MKTEISLIRNNSIFTSEHRNQTTKNIRRLPIIQVNSKKKWLKAYTRENPNMPRIPEIPSLMKHIMMNRDLM